MSYSCREMIEEYRNVNRERSERLAVLSELKRKHADLPLTTPIRSGDPFINVIVN